MKVGGRRRKVVQRSDHGKREWVIRNENYRTTKREEVVIKKSKEKVRVQEKLTRRRKTRKFK